MKAWVTLVIFLFLSAPSVAESVDDLVTRNGLYYKKFSEIPFTGEINEGNFRGSFVDGMRVGSWEGYYENGQLLEKGFFNETGEALGYWIIYYEDGNVRSKVSYKNGKKEGRAVGYYPSGQLYYEGDYREGRREGSWKYYSEYGGLLSHTGTYKNGVKVGESLR